MKFCQGCKTFVRIGEKPKGSHFCKTCLKRGYHTVHSTASNQQLRHHAAKGLVSEETVERIIDARKKAKSVSTRERVWSPIFAQLRAVKRALTKLKSRAKIAKNPLLFSWSAQAHMFISAVETRMRTHAQTTWKPRTVTFWRDFLTGEEAARLQELNTEYPAIRSESPLAKKGPK